VLSGRSREHGESKVYWCKGIRRFFMAMAQQMAPWYDLKTPTILDPSRTEINAVFSLLLSLLCLYKVHGEGTASV